MRKKHPLENQLKQLKRSFLNSYIFTFSNFYIFTFLHFDVSHRACSRSA